MMCELSLRDGGVCRGDGHACCLWSLFMTKWSDSLDELCSVVVVESLVSNIQREDDFMSE